MFRSAFTSNALPALHELALSGQIHASSSAVAALAWWIVPILGVLGAITYVVWVSKFQQRYENKTHRSVSKFKAFQESFGDDKTDLK